MLLTNELNHSRP